MSVKNFHASQRKRSKTHGFLGRQETASGRKLVLRRRRKGRAKLAV